MKIIFLDIDGVLNAGNYCDSLSEKGMPFSDRFGNFFSPQCVASLERIINATNAKIVISSSWKRGVNGKSNYKELRELWLERKLPGEIIDTTPNFSYKQVFSILFIKGYEIEAWLNDFSAHSDIRLDSYAVIDDENVVLNAQRENFIQVNGFIGLSEQDADKAILLLNRDTIFD